MWLNQLLITLIVLAAGGLWLFAVASVIQALKYRQPGTSSLDLLISNSMLFRPDRFTAEAQPYLRRFRMALFCFLAVVIAAAALGILLSR